MNHQDRQRQKLAELQQRWQDLSAHIEAIVQQLGYTTDAEQNLALNKRRQALEADRNALEPQIQQLEAALEATPGSPSAESPDDFRYDAFISYSSKDGDWVHNTLLPRLEGEGLRICIDFRDFEIGAPSLVNMENAVERSRKTLLVLTPAWLASEWTDFEALLVQGQDPAGRARRILPLLLKRCPSLPGRLKIFTYLNLTDPAKLDAQMGRLVAAIRSAPTQAAPGAS
jgi:hypothetical protein